MKLKALPPWGIIMIPAVRPATTSFGKSRSGLYFFSADRMGKFDISTRFKENLERRFAIASLTFAATVLVVSSGCLYWDSNSETLTGLRSRRPTSSMLPVLVDLNLFCNMGRSTTDSTSGAASRSSDRAVLALLMVGDNFRGTTTANVCMWQAVNFLCRDRDLKRECRWAEPSGPF